MLPLLGWLMSDAAENHPERLKYMIIGIVLLLVVVPIVALYYSR